VLKGRVLLVEDEEAVLEFERDVMVGAGAEVTTSMSVEDAQQKLHKGAFDVVVMSGRMPGGWTAPELYNWIAKNCLGLEKSLLLTFSTVIDEQTRNFLQEHAIPSLAKPFEVADLISQVRALFHAHAHSTMEAKQSEDKQESKVFVASAGA
jgi:DNA-binding NtrC family response regulator